MGRRLVVVGALVAAALAGVALAAPANDTFPGTDISAATSPVAGSNVDATKESGEPNNHGIPAGLNQPTSDLGGVSVWYSWTAPADGWICFGTDFAGPRFDTTLGAWTGTAVSALAEVAFNDDVVDGIDTSSRIKFNATSGVTYRIGVGGYNGQTGAFLLFWREDCIPPDTTITSAKAGKGTITVTFTGTDDVTPAGSLTFECALDWGAFVACASPYTFTGVSAASHAVLVRAIDAAGNVDPVAARVYVRVRSK